MKIIAGSILAGLSLLAEVVNEWLHHFFWAAFNIAHGVMIEGARNSVLDRTHKVRKPCKSSLERELLFGYL